MAKTDRITGNDSIGYLRVSRPGQVKTDYDPEGISIPAQRVAVKKRARELKSPYIRDFVEPGRSARSIEQRPEFQDMMIYLRANPNIRYVIVYALSRFARNRYDDAIMMVTLEKLGVKLISATERNLDDSPTGRAMHGMIAVFNQYQSDASGVDISYKMSRKVIDKGGTLSRARIGYQNIRDTSDGREIRTIAIDEVRAPLVREAFERYATGEYTTEGLHALMVERGLTTRPSPKRPGRHIPLSTLQKMLRDRYYVGDVAYKGEWYPGRHTALVSKELFERVQRVLDSHSGAGVRQRKYNHYLKGVFWCKRCGSRFIVSRAQGNGGVYFYFYCHGTKTIGCNQPYVPMETLEAELLNYYWRVRLSEDFRRRVAACVEETGRDEQASSTHLEQRVTKRLAELEAQEDRYLDLLGDPDWPQDKLKVKMAAVRSERTALGKQLVEAQSTLAVGRQLLDAALALLERPHELYRQSDKAARRLMTITIFGKLLVDTKEIVGHELNEPFSALVSVDRSQPDQSTRRAYERRDGALMAPKTASPDLSAYLTYDASRGTFQMEGAPAWDELTSADLLASALVPSQGVQGSNKPAMVGDTGIESLSPGHGRHWA